MKRDRSKITWFGISEANSNVRLSKTGLFDDNFVLLNGERKLNPHLPQ